MAGSTCGLMRDTVPANVGPAYASTETVTFCPTATSAKYRSGTAARSLRGSSSTSRNSGVTAFSNSPTDAYRAATT